MNYNFYETFFEQLKIEEILIYLRKSRSDDPSLSVEEVLERHETRLQEWAERMLKSRIPEENILREVVSGETIAARPEMIRLLSLIESPKYKAVLTIEPQRLSRGDLEDAGKIIKLFRFSNTLICTPPKNYDLRDDYDREFFERELKRGNEFLEYQKKIMNNGRLLSVSQGNYVGSIAPYGFDRIEVKDGKRKCHTLIENKDEADAVRLMFDLYVNENMGTHLIARRLDELGFKPRKGERWSSAAIIDMLDNVHYIGKVRWNWRKTIKVVEDGEVVATRPKQSVSEYLTYDGKHDPIVSEEIFYAAQEKKGRNHRAKPTTKIRNPLAGIVYCHCGRAMSLRTYKKNGIERADPRLICDGQTHCKTGSCLYDEMLDRVVMVLKECIEDFEIRLKNDDADSIKLHLKLVANLEKKYEELNKKELSQWEKYTDEKMPKHIFDALNEKVLKEKMEVQEALCKAKNAIPDPVDYEEKIHRFSDALDALKDPEVPAILKNKLLKACIDRITYKREKPQQLKKQPGEKKGERFKTSGARWTKPPIELNIDLRV